MARGMACGIKTWLIIALVVLLVAIAIMQIFVQRNTQVPCLFVFGDSLSDSGNNNNLETLAKVAYPPYGIDFPTGPTPTGRYSNGRTAVDKLTELLGFEDFIPPFSNLSGSNILKGVNYASGSAGIRRESGTNLGTNLNMGLQLYHHMAIVSQISARLGFHKAKRHLKQCLYYMNIGTNGYEQNYFLPDSFDTSSKYTPEEYAKDLINRLSNYLQTLHDLEARKTVVVGLDRLGCIPRDAIFGSCDEEQNVQGFYFNDQLKSLVDELNNKPFTNSKYVFINTTAIIHDKSQGFTVTEKVCCPTNKDGVCNPDQTPCQNRNEYVFWDGIHSTEAANLVTATISYSTSNTAIAHPTNIKKLVQKK
uniref:Uncharacterized protein n=1 Tax=Lotus japonicus TaxID=34305 RepID=I3T226_LOTJA|nr:unknown [Lotus japonicus]